MHITLIGMSGSGKSFWSKRLEAESNFRRFGCDDEIQRKLAEFIAKDGFGNDYGRWVGFPFEARHHGNQTKYLATERAVMADAISVLECSPESENVVIDTSGSVIYCPEKMCQKLKKLSTVVYLETPQLRSDEMFERYVNNRRAVIWNGLFKSSAEQSESGQDKSRPTEIDLLREQYPELLKSRALLYKRYADITLSPEQYSDYSIPIEQFLNAITK